MRICFDAHITRKYCVFDNAFNAPFFNITPIYMMVN